MLVKKFKFSDGVGMIASEIVKGMKNIKFNVWEDVSIENIMKYRKGE
jgi:hypothetical protein